MKELGIIMLCISVLCVNITSCNMDRRIKKLEERMDDVEEKIAEMGKTESTIEPIILELKK